LKISWRSSNALLVGVRAARTSIHCLFSGRLFQGTRPPIIFCPNAAVFFNGNGRCSPVEDFDRGEMVLPVDALAMHEEKLHGWTSLPSLVERSKSHRPRAAASSAALHLKSGSGSWRHSVLRTGTLSHSVSRTGASSPLLSASTSIPLCPARLCFRIAESCTGVVAAFHGALPRAGPQWDGRWAFSGTCALRAAKLLTYVMSVAMAPSRAEDAKAGARGGQKEKETTWPRLLQSEQDSAFTTDSTSGTHRRNLGFSQKTYATIQELERTLVGANS